MVMTETLAGAVNRLAGSQPDAPALIWQDTVVSYRELAEDMRAVAAGVATLPAGPIGVNAKKSARAVTFVLGCLAAGRTVVLPSTTLPAETLDALFTHAGVGAVADASDLERFTDGDAEPSEVDIPFMLTTSGSTGVPKLVPLTAQGIERFTQWVHDEFDVGPGRRVLNYAPLNFDLCLFEIWATLRHGGCAVLVDPEIAADCDTLLAFLEETRPHVVQAVPLFYQLLTEAAGGTHTLSSVAHVIFTGDAMNPHRLPPLHDLFPNSRFHNIYGCTETNDSFRYEITPADVRRETLPLGEPLAGVRADLVADGEILTGPGVGELVVRTPFQSAGYHDNPSGAFGPHPVSDDGEQYFRSGDLVRRTEDGEYFLEGRADFRVKVRGQQVYLQHVEEVVLAAEGVVEAAAVAVPDVHAGRRLHVVVRRREDSKLNSLVLKKFLAERLPPAAVPSTLHIGSDPLPRTSTGKVDRQFLVNSQKR
jgi:acyl-coenzyme A synthetase/AMP-(fatty) acid ligase